MRSGIVAMSCSSGKSVLVGNCGGPRAFDLAEMAPTKDRGRFPLVFGGASAKPRSGVSFSYVDISDRRVQLAAAQK